LAFRWAPEEHQKWRIDIKRFFESSNAKVVLQVLYRIAFKIGMKKEIAGGRGDVSIFVFQREAPFDIVCISCSDAFLLTDTGRRRETRGEKRGEQRGGKVGSKGESMG
jgi:hypothetical protein